VRRGLRASAYAPDGVIEAAEVAGHPFALAVQRHPEERSDDVSQALFAALARASAGD
jgi:putative glutamine amidotransferase